MNFEGRWYWCDLCGHQAISCDVCKNSSCSGGGCDFCNNDFDKANELISQGLAPDKEGLPIKSLKKDLDELFGIT